MKKALLPQILKNIKSSYNNNKFKISAPTWNDKYEFQDYFYYLLLFLFLWLLLLLLFLIIISRVSYIQDYFEYIFKKHGEKIDNPSISIQVNKIENRITLIIKIGYYFLLLTPETMKLLGSTENKINKDKNCENLCHLEMKEVVSIVIL